MSSGAGSERRSVEIDVAGVKSGAGAGRQSKR